MRTEDGSIIHRCLNGEPEAFGILVDKYKEGIYAFAHTKLRDFRDAQDVTQEVFVRAYRDLRSLRRWESFAFWLYRIASARCKLYVRTQSRRVDQDFIEDQDPKALEANSMSAYRDDRVRGSLQESMDSLPETYREVLMLHYFGGMTIKDIAGAIGVSPGAVGMRLSRARAQLREEMTTMMDTAFEGQRLPAGFTFRIVEAVKRIKIEPMPRMAGLPWGLSLAVGIIVTVLSINPHLSIPSDIAFPTGSPLPAETKVLKTGEIPVDVLKISQISVIADNKGDGDAGAPRNAFMLAPQQGQGGKWTEKAPMQIARRSSAAGVVDGRIYVIGGQGPGGVNLPHVEVYDLVEDTWSKKSSIPTPRHCLFGGVVNGIIYAIGGWEGGWEGGFGPTVEAYNPATDEWTKKADMPTARGCSVVGVVDGKIYVIGGTMDASWSVMSTVEEYNPVTDTWTKRADMPTPRMEAAGSVVDGKIYVIGGTTQNFTPLSTVEVYDPATDTWTKKTSMPTARGWLSTTVVNGKIYAIGGGTRGNPFPTVEVYNPATDTWTKETDMPTARGCLSTCAVGGKIYAIGGSDLGDFNLPLGRGIVEEYDTGLLPKGIDAKRKLPTKWGEVRQ
jgi:RNA polymerase sigma factor (sigma-70 family)